MFKKFIYKIKIAKHFWSFWAMLGMGLVLIVLLLVKYWLNKIYVFDFVLILIVLIGFFVLLFLIDTISRVSRIELEKSQVDGMLKSMNDSVVAYDESFKITLVNNSFERLCGISEKELINNIVKPELNNVVKYSILSKIIFPSLAPELTRLSPDTNPSKVLIKIFKPRELILELITSRVENKYSHSFGFIKIIKDRTREEQLMRSKSDFITVAAHQLRTPLTGITWGVEVLAKKELGEINKGQEKILNQSLSALKEMSKTIDQLLKASSIEDGKFGYQFEMGDIIDIINNSLSSHLIKAEEKKIKFIFYPPEFKVPKFVMDKEKIKIVIDNLIDNAIKYNVLNGKIGVKIEPIKDKPFIKISISDTGIGINQKELKSVFEKFYRSPSVLKSHTSGIGLGLYITKNIVKNHGGDIWIESIEKRGTTFNFVLPTDQNYIPPQVSGNLKV